MFFAKMFFRYSGAHVQTTKVYFLKSFSNQKTQNHLFHPQKYMFKAPQRPNITQNSHVILKRSCQFNPIEWSITAKQFISSCRFKLLNIFLDTRCHQRGLGWKALSNEWMGHRTKKAHSFNNCLSTYSIISTSTRERNIGWCMEGIEGSAHQWTTFLEHPKEDPVHLDAAFSVGETYPGHFFRLSWPHVSPIL